MRWLVERFPGVRFVEENAAIGATGSELGVFRAQRDLVARNCDLVFVEFAVNDGQCPAQRRFHTREGLLRQLLAGQGRDIVLVYTFGQDMYQDMSQGRVPQSIADFEELGKHYDIGSSWMGLYALREVQAGRMRWEEWLPDGLHPQQRGSLSYGQCVSQFLERELGGSQAPTPTAVAVSAEPDALPEPLHPGHWQGARMVPLDSLQCFGSWRLRRWAGLSWIDQILETSAVGDRLQFEFSGRVLAMGFDFGKTSAEFRYRLDDGDWVDEVRERPDWVGPEGWYRISILAEDLGPGPHRCELEVLHGDRPDCTGTNFRLAMVGVVD